MKTIEKRIYYVSAWERGCFLPYSWECDVLASSISEARRIGVAVLEQKGLIERRRIHKTSIIESGRQIWTQA